MNIIKDHVIILIDGGEKSTQHSTSFHENILSKLSREGTYLNIMQATYNKSAANSILNSERFKVFPLRSGTRQQHSYSTPYWKF